MHTVLAYTSSRILLFVGAAVVLYVVGARGFLLVALAAVISGIASYVLLSGQRDRMSSAMAARRAAAQQRPDRGRGLSRRMARWRARIDAGTRAEDTEDAPEVTASR